MRNFKSPILLATLYLLLNTGCKKTETQQFTPGFNVYMAGTVNSDAVFWKNGQGAELATSSSATCIAVSGTDLFVGGQSNPGPGYWKNSQFTPLGQGSIALNGIMLSGSDVYVVGQAAGTIFIDSAGGSLIDVRSAVYWKNGVLNNLEPNSRGSAALGICFSGTDMYVVGHVFNDTDTAVQWKNGVRTNYTSDNGQTEIAYAVGVSGTDIYAVGVYNNLPVYWKNGIKTFLTLNNSPIPTSGYATAISIVGTDVYIAGVTSPPGTGYHATFWKNGVSTDLSNNTSDVSAASGIAVAGSDIYVVGMVSSAAGPNFSPAYWKNGVENKLSGTGSINAICVGN